MLLPDNIHPENSIYFNGATLLNFFKEENSYNFIELYQKVKDENNMSFPTYVLCIDWLYLINVAELKNGKISLCS